MSKKEQTVPIVIDQLDFMPNAFLGFTNIELMMTIAASSVFSLLPMVTLSKLIFGKAVFGFIVAVALGVFVGVWGAARAETLKKGRPSYMIWWDLKRRLQVRGLFGFKPQFGLVNTATWDVIHERKTK